MAIHLARFPSLVFSCRQSVGAGLGLVALAIPMLVAGQVAPITFDNSFGAVVLPADFGQNGNYQILESYGLKNETNLFHSFGEFSIPTGGSATFEIDIDVFNVISRVTGGNPSLIDGRISIDGGNGEGANFWMINPAGMMFGPNTVIDVGGTFNVGAADYLSFSEGLEFSSSDNSISLFVDNPLDFGFFETASNSGELSLEGLSLDVGRGLGTAALKLAGRSVSLDGVSISSTANPLDDTPSDIEISGGRIRLTDSTLQSSIVDKPFLAGNINLSAEFISIDASTLSADTFGEGDAGAIQIGNLLGGIQTDTVTLANGSLITSETFGAGHAGRIDIKSNSILANIGADGSPMDSAGQVIISSTSGFSVTDGSAAGFGAAGYVFLDGKSIRLASTLIEANTKSDITSFPAIIQINAISGGIELFNT